MWTRRKLGSPQASSLASLSGTHRVGSLPGRLCAGLLDEGRQNEERGQHSQKQDPLSARMQSLTPDLHGAWLDPRSLWESKFLTEKSRGLRVQVFGPGSAGLSPPI